MTLHEIFTGQDESRRHFDVLQAAIEPIDAQVRHWLQQAWEAAA